MGYKSTSIKKVISWYNDGSIILPAIQRNYVWGEDRIIELFDSLMKGYRIGTFLFWEVKDEELSSFVFNSFLSDIDLVDGNLRGPEVDAECGSFLSVLDGQQRITSLIVGLAGSYRSKVKKERKVNGEHPKRYLCFNPLFIPGESSLSYDFRFLSESEIESRIDDKWWVRLSDIFANADVAGVYDTFVIPAQQAGLISAEEVAPVMKTLPELINIINNESLLSYYTAANKSVEHVVKIFERVNNNGKPVSGVDLMLSLATVAAGREDMQTKIEESIKRVDAAVPYPNSFVPDKGFILTASLLVLQTESLSVSSVKNFEPKRVAKIYKNWDSVIDAICNAAIYVDRLGFDGKRIPKNYMHPIVHYFYRLAEKKGSFNAASYYDSLQNQNARHDRIAITQWLIRALINRVFVDGTGATLKKIGKTIDDYFKEAKNPSFPLSLLRETAGKRSLEVSEGLVDDRILPLRSKNNETLPLLTLLFGGGIQTKYEVEHMWPQSKMDTRSRIEKCSKTLSASSVEFYRAHYDTFPNFQLLNRTQNAEKGDQYFDEWVSACYETPEDLERYQNQFAVPKDVTLYEYIRFEDFYQERSKLLKERLLDFFDEDYPDTE